MADVEKLLHDYVAEHRAGGEADPRPYLDQAEGGERAELAALIDSYLAHAPGKAWDADAFAQSGAALARDRIVAEWGLEAGAELEAQTWRELLPALRSRAQIRRRELVERLASGIGHPADAELVSAYYHQMEIGRLPAEGVSDKVLRVLGEIVGETAERLRAAGSVVVPGGESEAGAMQQVAFARTAVADAQYSVSVENMIDDEDAETDELRDQLSPAIPHSSDVDRLFTGGPGAG